MDKKMWRFSNISAHALDQLENNISKVKEDYARSEALRHENVFDFTSVGCVGMAEWLYVYGYDMELVERTLKWGIKLGNNLARNRAWNPLPNMAPKDGEFSNLYRIGDSWLVNDVQCEIESREIAIMINKMPNDDLRYSKIEHHLLVEKLLDDEISSETQKLALSIVKDSSADFQFSDYYKRFALIALGDHAELNKQIQEAILNGDRGAESQRKKKRKIMAASNLVNFTDLSLIAIMLHYGLPLTVVDSSIPIWDFSYAQRSEIQKLLPPEVIELIPSRKS